MRVLVTAVGGDLGQAIVKALRLNEPPVHCYGCDTHHDCAGSAFVEQFFPVPPARHDNYVAAVDEICRQHSVDIVIPASEPEIELLSGIGYLPSGAGILCQRSEWIATYGDKLECMKALDGRVELAAFADGTNRAQVEELVGTCQFPLVVKARRSSGSTQFNVVHDRDQLTSAIANTDGPVVQEWIDAAHGEYSVGVFASEHFTSLICFNRQLGYGGASWVAQCVDDDDVLDYVGRIARIAGARGSINIQVRKSSKGVRLLEINPRFSSLVALRALCGFRDVQWSMDLMTGTAPARPAGPFRQVRFRRFVHEVVDLGGGFGAVTAWAPRTCV